MDERSEAIFHEFSNLLRKLESAVSPPEWWTQKRVTWLYCPGHAGVGVNEKADRLAGAGSTTTSRIALSASDFKHLHNIR